MSQEESLGGGFWRAKEAAKFLGVGEETCRKWAQRGLIPSVHFGRSLRFDPEQIKTWAKTQVQSQQQQVIQKALAKR